MSARLALACRRAAAAAVVALLILSGTQRAAAQLPDPSLAGTWRMQSTDILGAPMTTETLLGADGAYGSVQWSANNRLVVDGRWFVQGGMLGFRVLDWAPKEWCGPLGCRPITIPMNSLVPFQRLDADTLQTPEGIARRLR